MSVKLPIDFKSLPERIRQRRLSLRLSQENVADSLGISTSAYGDIERGQTELTLSRLEKIGEILDETLPNLLGIADEKEVEIAQENKRLKTENARLVESNALLRARLIASIPWISTDEEKERRRIGF